MQPHAVQNIGDTPATYYVINWASPGTEDEEDSADAGAVDGAVVSLLRRLPAFLRAARRRSSIRCRSSGVAFCQRSRSRWRCSGVSFLKRW